MTLNSAHSLAASAMRPSRKPRIILILLIGLCGLFVYSYASRLGEKSRVEAQIAAVQTQIENAKQEQYKLLAERDDLDKPDFLDRVAREYFGLAKPGDKLLVIVNEPAAAGHTAEATMAATAAANPIDYRNFPIWQQWVVFFTTDTFALSLSPK